MALMDLNCLLRGVPGLDGIVCQINQVECNMTNFLKNTFARFAKDEKGVTLVEYGIALILAVTVGTVALTNLGNNVIGEMDEAGALMN